MVTVEDLNKLRELQDILSRKISLEQTVQEMPKELVNLEGAYNKTRKLFIETSVEHDKIKEAEAEARASLKEAEAAREKAEMTISEINTQREYEALDKERLAAEEKELQFGREVQQKEKALFENTSEMTRLSGLIEQFEKELEQKRAVIDAERAEKTGQIDNLLSEEKRLTSDLDKEVVFKFERILRNKSGIGIVGIKGNVCMGCHMILPAQFSNNVRIGAEFVFCPYCSRILFYEEAPEGEEIFFDSGDSGSLYDPEEDEEEFEDDEREEEKIVVDFDE